MVELSISASEFASQYLNQTSTHVCANVGRVLRDSASGHDNESVTWEALARVVVLCNRAEFKAGQENVPVIKRYVSCMKLERFSAVKFTICTANFRKLDAM